MGVASGLDVESWKTGSPSSLVKLDLDVDALRRLSPAVARRGDEPCRVALANGQATLTVPAFGPGEHVLSAAY